MCRCKKSNAIPQAIPEKLAFRPTVCNKTTFSIIDINVNKRQRTLQLLEFISIKALLKRSDIVKDQPELFSGNSRGKITSAKMSSDAMNEQ